MKIRSILGIILLVPMSCAARVSSYNYAGDNKYTVTFFYTDAVSRDEQKKLVRIFNRVAHNKRYAHAGLRFRARYLDASQFVTTQQLYDINAGSTLMIFRNGEPYKNARMVGLFSKGSLTDFIEQWLGDYISVLLVAQKEAKRAATAVAYASYPSYPYYGIYAYPYYGYGGYGYGGFGVGYNMQMWF